jgi:hypothetical protein
MFTEAFSCVFSFGHQKPENAGTTFFVVSERTIDVVENGYCENYPDDEACDCKVGEVPKEEEPGGGGG